MSDHCNPVDASLHPQHHGRAARDIRRTRNLRIILSLLCGVLLLGLCVSACELDADGIGTSPSVVVAP